MVTKSYSILKLFDDFVDYLCNKDMNGKSGKEGACLGHLKVQRGEREYERFKFMQERLKGRKCYGDRMRSLKLKADVGI